MKTVNIKWIYLIVLSLIWGSSFILIKKGLIGLSPLQLGSLRILFSAVFLIIIGYKSLTEIKHYQWKYIALSSLFGTFIPAFLFAIAETEISSSVTSILNSLTPLNTLIIGSIAFGLTTKRTQVFGVIVGFFGTFLLIVNGALHHPTQNYWYTVIVVIASICYATNVNLIKKYLSDVKSLSITTGNFVVLFLPALIILLSTDFLSVAKNVEVQQSMIYIVILGIVGTGIANIIFFKLIQISTPVFATSVTYLIPIVAIFWGFLDNEYLTPVQVIGAFIVLVGVYLSSKK